MCRRAIPTAGTGWTSCPSRRGCSCAKAGTEMVRRRQRRCGRRKAEAGFTLIEVLIGLLVAMIGLIGTVAFQHTILRATAVANDAQVATQLATRTMEELNTRRTQASPFVDALGPIASGAWTTPVFLDARRRVRETRTETARWQMRSR